MSAAQPILRKAQSVLHKAFSTTYARENGNHHLEAYCAAFVRWCYRATGKPLAIVRQPEFYRHLGLRFTAGENTADSLSGHAVGDVVTKQIRAGDILLFSNTYGTWPYGTITHVGIASETVGMMYDAGSGSIVHHRRIKGTFRAGSELVEVRRPLMLGGDVSKATGESGLPKRLEENATRIHYKGGLVSAKYKGKPIRDLNVLLLHDGGVGVEGHKLGACLVSLIIHDVSGKVYKVHQHDNRHFMTSDIGRIWLSVTNGMLEVSFAYISRFDKQTGKKERWVLDHDTGRMEQPFHAIKPTSVELTILH